MHFSEHYELNEISDVAIKKAKDKFIKAKLDKDEVNTILDKFKELSNKNRIKGIDLFASSFDDIKKVVTDAEAKKSSKEVRIKLKSGADKVFENKKVLIVSPQTHEASCYYGAGTKWCTTAKDANFFKSYKNKGVKFYYLIPKDSSGKIAVAVYVNGKKEIYDAEDRRLEETVFNKIIENLNIPKDIFKPAEGKELEGMSELTEEQINDLAEGFVKVLGIYPTDEEYVGALDTAKEMITQEMENIIEGYGDETLTNEQVKEYIEERMSGWEYDIDYSLNTLEANKGIKADSNKNKTSIMYMAQYGDLQYEIDHYVNGKVNDIGDRIEEMNWEYIYTDNIDDLTDKLGSGEIDEAGWTLIEEWLKWLYDNSIDTFRDFYDEFLISAKKENIRVDDTDKEELKKIIDKVEKVEYGKQGHPALNLSSKKYNVDKYL